MRIELTVRVGNGTRDVAITAPDAAPLGRVLPALRAAIGVGDTAELWHDDRRLLPATRMSASGLRAGSMVTVGRTPERAAAPAVLSLQIVGGPNAGAVFPLGRGRLHIGRADDCEITLADADVSRRHAVIDVGATTITLRDLDSTNGTTVDGCPVPVAGCSLRPGALIAVGDSLLSLSGPAEVPATVQPGDDGTQVLLRPPRRRHLVVEREIELPTRGAATRPRGVQWVTAVLPAVAGGAIAWISDTPQFLLFALLSPVMMISTSLGDRLHWRRSRRRDAVSYRRRRADADREIAAALAAETAVRRSAAPDPATVLRSATLPGSRLWERRRGDPDLLHLRLGSADLPSTTQTRQGPAVAPAGRLGAVPLSVDLRRGPLGVAGPTAVVDGLLRWLVGQLAALHSPADVELVLLLDPQSRAGWTWARWLPHLRGRVATSGAGWAAIVADLAATVDQRLAVGRLDPSGWAGPWLVLIVDRAARLAEVAGLAEVIERGGAVGLTAICVDREVAGLPSSCRSVARVSGTTGTRLLLRTPAGPADTTVVIDQVSHRWADTLARSLAPLVDAGTPGSATLPDHCRLLEVLGVTDLDDAALDRRWAASSGGARTVLGIASDGPLELDLAADGPHALVAGTTGAGKSELLQTLVAGLATNHPPDDVSFLLIDYKGGAAFADCARLPHTAGLVTDLDPYLTERALRSLHSELRRRERLFAARGAADLSAYRGTDPPERVPRLVIVVDEFAALVDELPDFVHGLIGVAQRGRSLGVHLVLATQRPGRAVSAEIRANTGLRIALRVTDPAESSDVIDGPEAATIERSTPGRAYLRAGSVLRAFQTAQAAATAPARTDDEITVEPLGSWRRAPGRAGSAESGTDVARLVDALARAAQRTGRRPARSPWSDPLPTVLARSALARSDPDTSVALARVDLPDEQRQSDLVIDLRAGATLLVSGAGRSGRTSALASLALGAAVQLDPARLHVHLVDARGTLAGALQTLPHAATTLGPDDLHLVPRLFLRLERECARRIAAGAGDGRRPGESRPDLLLLVDGWETLVAALPDLDAAGTAEALANLLRVGPAAGLSIALAGDRSTLAPRFAGGFATRIVLRLSDRTDYAMAGVPARNVPNELPPGRGLRADDGAVVQIAHPGASPTGEELRECAAALARRWPPGSRPGPAAIRIRPLPVRVPLADVPAAAGRLSIGLAGDELDPMTLDPFGGGARTLVAGPPRSGRTTVLCSLARQASAAGLATLVVAPSRSPLTETARALSLPVVGPADALGDLPTAPTLLLVDDSDAFVDSPVGERLTSWLRMSDTLVAAVVAGRSDDLATAYRGIGAEVRRSHCGILLRPGPVDGELLGVRLPRRPSTGPPGRGVAVGDPSWGPLFADGEPVPVQVATP